MGGECSHHCVIPTPLLLYVLLEKQNKHIDKRDQFSVEWLKIWPRQTSIKGYCFSIYCDAFFIGPKKPLPFQLLILWILVLNLVSKAVHLELFLVFCIIYSCIILRGEMVVIWMLPTGCQQVTNCRPTVGRQLVICRPTVGRQLANSRPTVGANCQPTVGQQLADCCPTVGQQSADSKFWQLFFTITVKDFFNRYKVHMNVFSRDLH